MSWTGGQYSLARAVFGAFLIVLLVSQPPWSFWTGLAVAGAVLLAAGWRARIAALVVVAFWLALLARRIVPVDVGSLSVLAALAAQLAVPPAPYGAWSARGRDDPGGGWRFPPWIHAVLWTGLVAGYVYADLLGLLLVPPALWRRTRPWLWLGLVTAELARFDPGVWLLLIFCFDPGWIRPRGADERETLYYDGACGLCHRTVRFVLAEDPDGRAFSFAPLQSASFGEKVPDSLVLVRAGGPPLVRAAAVRHVLSRLGGIWTLTAAVSGIVPAPLLDLGYRAIAAVRHRLFARPEALCPTVPDRLRDRFVG